MKNISEENKEIFMSEEKMQNDFLNLEDDSDPDVVDVSGKILFYCCKIA